MTEEEKKGECRTCKTSVPVTPTADNERSAGRRYVARLAAH